MKYKFTISKDQALLQFTATPKEAKKLYNQEYPIKLYTFISFDGIA